MHFIDLNKTVSLVKVCENKAKKHYMWTKTLPIFTENILFITFKVIIACDIWIYSIGHHLKSLFLTHSSPSISAMETDALPEHMTALPLYFEVEEPCHQDEFSNYANTVLPSSKALLETNTVHVFENFDVLKKATNKTALVLPSTQNIGKDIVAEASTCEELLDIFDILARDHRPKTFVARKMARFISPPRENPEKNNKRKRVPEEKELPAKKPRKTEAGPKNPPKSKANSRRTMSQIWTGSKGSQRRSWRWRHLQRSTWLLPKKTFKDLFSEFFTFSVLLLLCLRFKVYGLWFLGFMFLGLRYLLVCYCV